MAKKTEKPTSNAEPMTYTRVSRPNLRNQRVREGEPIAVPETAATPAPLDTTPESSKKGGK